MIKTNLLIIFLFIFLTVSGQNIIKVDMPSVLPVSPDAATMAKHETTSINYSKGLASIIIPLYEIKSGDLTLPLYLSYNHSGLKPNEPSGRVGTGWTLIAEPSVMRYVKGLPDEQPDVGYRATNADYSNFKNLFDEKADLEPDEFHYSTISGGGSFYTGKDSESRAIYVSYPERNDIIKNNNGQSTFSIYTKDGILHHYGNNNIETTMHKYTPIVTRWMCNSIHSSKTRAKIDFTYQISLNSDFAMEKNDCLSIEDSVTGISPLCYFSNGFSTQFELIPKNDNQLETNNISIKTYKITPKNNFNNSKVNRINIRKIDFANGSATFNFNNKNINNIVIKDKNNTTVRLIQFFISRYNDQTSLTKLDSVRIYAQGVETLVYRFSYFNSTKVPPISTNAIDHWGYYNGKNSNMTTIPNDIINVLFGSSNRTYRYDFNWGGNRDCSPYYTQTGVLKTIAYPNGIVTRFSYEGNIANKDVENNKKSNYMVGGLRIKSIKETDYQTNSKRIRTLTYGLKENTSNETSTIYDNVGLARKIVTINDYNTIQLKKTYKKNNACEISRFRTWVAQPLTQITYYDGSTTLYNYVKEKKYSNKTDGKSEINIYCYDLPNTNRYIEAKRSNKVPFAIKTVLDYRESGLLVYKEKLIDNILVSHTEYEYDVVNDIDYGFPTLKPYQTVVTSHEVTPTGEDIGQEYKAIKMTPTSRWTMLKKEINTNNVQGGKRISSTTEYDYNTNKPIYHKEPKCITRYLERGKFKKDYFVYPTDAKEIDENLGARGLIERHRYSEPIQYKETMNETTRYTRVKYEFGKPKIIKTRNGEEGNFVQQISFTYNRYGNYQTITDKSNLNISYLWGYNNQYPIAEIKNSTVAPILSALNKPESWLDELEEKIEPDATDFMLISKIRQKLSSALVTTYSYTPLIGDITSICNPRGVVTHYENDKYGRLQKAYYKENNQTKPIVEYQYHLGTKLAVSTNKPEDPIIEPISSVTITGNFVAIPQNGFLVGDLNYDKENQHSARVEGGSGNFTYDWTITYCSDMGATATIYRIIKKSNQNISFTVSDRRVKIVKMRCDVYDNVLDKEKTNPVSDYKVLF